MLKRFSYVLFLGSIALGLLLSCDTPNPGSEETDMQRDGKTVVPVEARVVTPRSVEQSITLTGVLQPLRAVDIVAEVSGKITRIYKQLGDAVTTRDVIAKIDDKIPKSNFEQAKAQVLSTETNLKIARLNLKSDEELYKNGDISELEYQSSLLAVKTAEANHQSALAGLSQLEKAYQDTRIKSPVSGVISRKHINTGTMVTNNMPLFRVVDLSTLKMEVGIPQEMIRRVKLGNEAQILISGLSSSKFTGVVQRISPEADERTGTFNVEVHVANTDDQIIKAGMTARIDVKMRTANDQLIVPDHALVQRNGDKYVYKIQKETAVLQQVETGETIGGQVIIYNGVAEGDTIVVVGMKNLGVETPVWLEEVHQ